MSDTEKILVVVDVQNCFMINTLQEENELEKGKSNSLNQKILPFCKKMIEQINELIGKNTHIILTRDFHPCGHKSFAGPGIRPDPPVTWPAHCRNKESVCSGTDQDPRNKPDYQNNLSQLEEQKIIISPEILDKAKASSNYIIKGPDLSYLYYQLTNPKYISDTIYDINIDTKREFEMGLKDPNSKDIIDKTPNFNNLKNPNTINAKLKDGKSFYTLNKGQYCEYESYSAFNYHLKIAGMGSGQLDPDKNLSTGLWELILSKCPGKNLDITICGLVGDVCVIHSFLQGALMWKMLCDLPGNEALKDIEVTLNYSLLGTLFCQAAVPIGNGSPSPILLDFSKTISGYKNDYENFLDNMDRLKDIWYKELLPRFLPDFSLTKENIYTKLKLITSPSPLDLILNVSKDLEITYKTGLFNCTKQGGGSKKNTHKKNLSKKNKSIKKKHPKNCKGCKLCLKKRK